MGLKKTLKEQMEAKRQLMIVSANKNGFTSSETIRHSQELDHLMNIYRRIANIDEKETSAVK